MNISLILICAAVLLCACVSVEAEDIPARPGAYGINIGQYSTFDNTLLPGRMSESWLGDSLYFFVPGNVVSMMSWDGDSLGSQWRIWGAEPDSDGALMTSYSLDVNGTGFIDYIVNYSGGWIWVDNTYFGDGTISLDGSVRYMNIGVRFSIFQHQVLGVTSNIMISGDVFECPRCLYEFDIVNAFCVRYPGSSEPLTEEYPEFSGTATTGSQWDLCCLIFNIACNTNPYLPPYCNQIGVETSSWGKIKSMHR